MHAHCNEKHLLTLTAPVMCVAAGLLTPLQSRCKSEVGVELKFHVKGKQDDGSGQIKELISALKSPGENSLIGILGKVTVCTHWV
jgi:hypothetical protein